MKKLPNLQIGSGLFGLLTQYQSKTYLATLFAKLFYPALPYSFKIRTACISLQISLNPWPSNQTYEDKVIWLNSNWQGHGIQSSWGKMSEP